jgi:hypothetical protein
MIKYFYIISLFITFVITSVASIAQTPHLDDIEKNAEQRIRSYNGLEFSVKSSLYIKNNKNEKIDSLPELRETIRFHFPEKGPVWKYWTQEIQDKFDQQWILNRFKVTNISETRNFIYTPEGEGKWSKGGILPWYSWDEDEGRSFFTFLGMGTVGISSLNYNDYKQIRKQYTENLNYQFIKEGTCNDKKIFIFQGSNDKLGAVFEMHFTSIQGMMIHFGLNAPKEKYTVVFDVEKIGSFENIYYPKKGKLRRSAQEHAYGIDYKFEVTDVHRFDSQLVKNWFPQWPSSTIVVDSKTDEHITIPPSERQLKKVAEEWNTQEEQAKYPYLNVVRIIFVIAGVMLMFTGLFLTIRKRYHKA